MQWILVLFGSVIYSFLGAVNHYRFQTSGYDLGIYMQAIWQYAHARLPYSTVLDNGVPLLGNHFGPILILIAPLYRMFPSGYTLLIVQAVWVSLGALPIYWWAKARLPTKILPFIIGGLYLIHPGIQAALSFDFHLAALGATFLAFVLYYGLERQWRKYWVWFGLSLGVKEDLLLVLAMFGVYMCCRRWWKQGLLTVGISGGLFLLLILFLMPAINPRRDVEHTADKFVSEYLGNQSLTQVVIEPILHPRRFLGGFSDFVIKRESQLVLVLPFGGFQLLSPLSWMLAAPIWYERFLSPNMNFWVSRFQYGATSATIFAFGSINGLVWLWEKLRRRVEEKRFAVYASAVMIAGFLITPIWFYPPLYRLGKADFYETDLEIREAFMQALALIPPDASVVAYNALVPRLANRSEVYAYISGSVYPAEYAVLVKDQDLVPYVRKVHGDIDQLKYMGYETLMEDEVVVVLKEVNEN